MARDHDGSLPVTEKRGRGWPRKPDALTNTQRQAAFRARHKAAGKPVALIKSEYDGLALQYERLREELAQARRGTKPCRASPSLLLQPPVI